MPETMLGSHPNSIDDILADFNITIGQQPSIQAPHKGQGIMASRLLTAMTLAAMLAWTTCASARTMSRPPPSRWSDMERFPRHRFVMTTGVPAPYAAMRNPLARSAITLERGASVYRLQCQSCHGIAATGHGFRAKTLSPSPFDLFWLSQMKVSRFDGFMYWSIALGGTPFQSSMPRYDQTLPPEDIWAVITYIQDALPPR